ncbi:MULTISPECIES: outer membrane protein assembly factor BamE [Pseudomonas]|uniref:outer membrane protein assembly factor BamE domain-containing protein n=1 Tax=Pseudomonas TaxID=286 RepID=UPI001F1F88E5|nr:MULTISPECIES: outer membrane protein assembly factor BamE [Pseudomonas]MDU4255775.1 outer membrane protein assembly factor BamE [Pseudomonas sp.]
MNKAKSIPIVVAMVVSWMFGAGVAASSLSQSNPVDKLSNPNALDFVDVYVDNPDFNATFARDGVVSEPQRFQAVRPGVAQKQIQSALGIPLKQQKGPRGIEWDYNFKLWMASSESFLVCQYKVVFNEQQLVREAVWRRQQCRQLVNGQAAE